MIAYFATARIAQNRARMYGYCRATEKNLIRAAVRKQRKTGCDTASALDVVRGPGESATGGAA